MNWKTTVTSAISATASLVLFMQQLHYATFPNWLTGIAMFCSIGGLAAFGIAAKDKDVTGGTKGQPSTPIAIMEANQAPSTVNPPIPKPDA
jgi:hypothetical protein